MAAGHHAVLGDDLGAGGKIAPRNAVLGAAAQSQGQQKCKQCKNTQHRGMILNGD